MKCPNCSSEFNREENLPLILIHCGHTLCIKCINLLLVRRHIICPECYVLNEVPDIEALPRNMLLLSLNRSESLLATDAGALHRSSEVQSQTVLPSRNRDNTITCEKHGKKIDAFCRKDKSVLCIDCILSDKHKNHEIEAVHDAVVTEKSLISEALLASKDIEKRLLQTQAEVRRAVVELNTSASRARNQISSIYQEITAKIKVVT